MKTSDIRYGTSVLYGIRSGVSTENDISKGIEFFWEFLLHVKKNTFPDCVIGERRSRICMIPVPTHT